MLKTKQSKVEGIVVAGVTINMMNMVASLLTDAALHVGVEQQIDLYFTGYILALAHCINEIRT
jgi:hypothetical protein